MIVRFCGKKTPLVRRKRRHRRSVHHETADAEDQAANQSQDEDHPERPEESVQVHPAVVELSLPFGKKVRLGEKKKSSSGHHHQHRSSRSGDDQERSGASSRVLEGVARATRLAGNLGQRIASMPNGSSSETNPIAAAEDSSSSSPSKEKRSSRGIRSGVGIINTKRRPFKSLSPDKRLIAKNLAESVSRSFEKLDLVSPRKIVERKRKKTVTEGNERSASADADNRRRKRKERKETAKSSTTVAPPTHGKELTIAKLGKFTFSLEVNNGAKKVAEVVDPEREERRKRRERRKKSREEQHKRRSKKEEEEEEHGKEEEKEKEKVEAEPSKVRRPSLVVVSKRQKSDRPLRVSTSPDKRAAAEEDDFVDYRLTFGRRQKTSQDSFSRSISHPGPPPSVAEIIIAGLDSNGIKRNNSFAGDKLRPEKLSSRLKRSETEKSSGLEWSKRLGGAGSGTSGALLLSPKPAFENRAYDKSPEPKSGQSEQQKSESLNYLKDRIKSSLNPEETGSRKGPRKSRPSLLNTKSSSLDAPSTKGSKDESGFFIEFDSDSSSSSLSDSKRLSPPTQVQSLSEESANGDQRHFGNDVSTSSSDSEMEIVVIGQKSTGVVSRSKIIERVAKKEKIPETQSRALLLASSLSSSSISMSPSEDEEKSNLTRRKNNVDLPEASNVEFIFPGNESKSPSLQQTSLSVSSLSERYSRKDSSTSTSTSSSLASPALKTTSQRKKSESSKTNKNEDLDNISILTDGMG